MKSNWWTRYTHIHRVAKGVCPCCERKGGEYSLREFPHHFWVYFTCKGCGYELREHVMREKEAPMIFKTKGTVTCDACGVEVPATFTFELGGDRHVPLILKAVDAENGKAYNDTVVTQGAAYKCAKCS